MLETWERVCMAWMCIARPSFPSHLRNDEPSIVQRRPHGIGKGRTTALLSKLVPYGQIRLEWYVDLDKSLSDRRASWWCLAEADSQTRRLVVAASALSPIMAACVDGEDLALSSPHGPKSLYLSVWGP